MQASSCDAEAAPKRSEALNSTLANEVHVTCGALIIHSVACVVTSGAVSAERSELSHGERCNTSCRQSFHFQRPSGQDGRKGYREQPFHGIPGSKKLQAPSTWHGRTGSQRPRSCHESDGQQAASLPKKRGTA